jgi:hypothetical protein
MAPRLSNRCAGTGRIASHITHGTPVRGVWPFFRPGAASRRDRTIVARHEVPGKVSPRDPSRRVRRDRRDRGLVADGNTEEREEVLNRRSQRGEAATTGDAASAYRGVGVRLAIM